MRRLLLLAAVALVPFGILTYQSWDILGGRALASRADLRARLADRVLAALPGLDRATIAMVDRVTAPLGTVPPGTGAPGTTAPVVNRLEAASRDPLVIACVAFPGPSGAPIWAARGHTIAERMVPDEVRDSLILAGRRSAVGTFVAQGRAGPLLLIRRSLAGGVAATLALDGKAVMAVVGQPLLDRAGLGADARFAEVDADAGAARQLVAPEQLPTDWSFAAVEMTHGAAARMTARANRSQWTARTGFVVLILVTFGALVGMTRLAAREVELAQLKLDFVSAVSHELQTPLGVIRLYTDLLLLGRVAPGKEPKDYLQQVSAETQRLARLVQNILTYSVARRGRKAYELREIDLRDVVAEAIATLAPEADTRGIALTLDAAAPALALADREGARQAILNVVSNAIKYGRSSAEVSVCAKGAEIAVVVRDDGPGIPLVEQKRVFKPFYRIGREATRTSLGTGLGLAIVREIMQAHRGKVSLESPPGGGATFVLGFRSVRGHYLRNKNANDLDCRG